MRIGTGTGLVAGLAVTVMVAAWQELIPDHQELWRDALYVSAVVVVLCVVRVFIVNLRMNLSRYKEQLKNGTTIPVIPGLRPSTMGFQKGSGIIMRNVTSIGNRGDGIRIEGIENVDMDGVYTAENGGKGINLIAPEPTKDD